MASFRDLTSRHATIVLDAASAQVQVGLIVPGQPARWATSPEESGIALFQGLSGLDADPLAVDAFVFCEGPGSILGIRTAAMAVRAWCELRPRPVYAYGSLELVAVAAGRTDWSVIADARRDTWHRFRIGEGLRRLAPAALTGPLVMPEGFRHWSALPEGVTLVPYRLAELLEAAAEADLLRAVDAPDAFLHEEPVYATWTPHVHRAP